MHEASILLVVYHGFVFFQDNFVLSLKFYTGCIIPAPKFYAHLQIYVRFSVMAAVPQNLSVSKFAILIQISQFFPTYFFSIYYNIVSKPEDSNDVLSAILCASGGLPFPELSVRRMESLIF